MWNRRAASLAFSKIQVT